MSLKMMSLVWEHAPVSQTGLLVLLALADMADDDGRCWPLVSTLARKARLSERQVQRLTAELVASGWLERSERRGHSTLYRITPKGGDTHVTPDTAVTPDTHVTQGVTPTSPTPDMRVTPGVTPVSPRTTREPSRIRQGTAQQPDRLAAAGLHETEHGDFSRWLRSTGARSAGAVIRTMSDRELADRVTEWRESMTEPVAPVLDKQAQLIIAERRRIAAPDAQRLQIGAAS